MEPGSLQDFATLVAASYATWSVIGNVGAAIYTRYEISTHMTGYPMHRKIDAEENITRERQEILDYVPCGMRWIPRTMFMPGREFMIRQQQKVYDKRKANSKKQ